MSIVATSPAELVRDAFERYGQKVKYYRSKNYYATNNPTREDDRPSLIFGNRTNGSLYFKDYAAPADSAAILHTIGLDPASLKAESKEFKPGPKRRPSTNSGRSSSPKIRLDFDHPNATYPYTTADGLPSYQVRRVNFTRLDGKPDKEFKQYRWQEDRWQKGRGDTPELLYRLPEVVKATKVLGGEGEKVVEALRSLGYVATTHAGGAKSVDKALPAYREWLRDKDFIYLPDNDDPGRAMANTLENGRIPVKSGATVDPAQFGGPKADIADYIARRRAELLSSAEIRAEVDAILAQARLWGQPAQPGPKELERRAQAEAYKAQAQAERAAKEAAKEAAKAAQQVERIRRWEAGNPILFDDDEEVIDPDYIEYKRAQFTNAQKWRDYVLAHWPQVSDRVQYEIKLKENREARPGKCGEFRKMTLPNGRIVTTRWTCGVCEQCLKRGVWTYRRALNEIQGIPWKTIDADILPGTKKPREEITGEFGSLPSYKARPYVPVNSSQMVPPVDDDLSEFDQPADARPENDPTPTEAPYENAPPLPQVKGELSIVRIWGDKERLRLGRELRTGGISHKSFPITLEDGPAYDFIINDDRGDPLGLVTDERIALWVKGVEGKRASGPNKKKKAGPAAAGPLLPSLKSLQERYSQALPYEVVMPELDDEGQPVDPDIFALELPDIGTTAPLPDVLVDFEVKDAASLQAALLEIHREQWKILGRRGDVNYGVCVHKKFYTRYLTLPAMLADFNAAQEAIRQRRRKKTG